MGLKGLTEILLMADQAEEELISTGREGGRRRGEGRWHPLVLGDMLSRRRKTDIKPVK